MLLLLLLMNAGRAADHHGSQISQHDFHGLDDMSLSGILVSIWAAVR